VIGDLVAELLGSLIGAIPDGPPWLRLLVVLVYVLVIAGCFVGLVIVVLSALS
jgi:hypothetical protein